MAAGGLVSARKVAETMSARITSMNQGQGFVGNAVASFLVIMASRLGLPVSTTHVSCGALFGIGLTTGQANTRMIAAILCAWITTLPLGMALGMTGYWIGAQFGGL
jgi:PiT family inorganic phosphate transporter